MSKPVNATILALLNYKLDRERLSMLSGPISSELLDAYNGQIPNAGRSTIVNLVIRDCVRKHGMHLDQIGYHARVSNVGVIHVSLVRYGSNDDIVETCNFSVAPGKLAGPRRRATG